jgi:hypothetical protein
MLTHAGGIGIAAGGVAVYTPRTPESSAATVIGKGGRRQT